MTLLVVNDPNISIGITEDNTPLALTVDGDIALSLTVSNETIPVVDYGIGGTTVYSKSDLGTAIIGNVWTLNNTKAFASYFLVRNGAIIMPNDYSLGNTVNATITFTNVTIFSDDVLLFIGFT
jgi:hypothetical protein